MPTWTTILEKRLGVWAVSFAIWKREKWAQWQLKWCFLDPKTSLPFQFGSPGGPDHFHLHMSLLGRSKLAGGRKIGLVGFLVAFSLLGHYLLCASQHNGAFGSIVEAKNKIDSRICSGTNMFLPPAPTSGTDVPFSVKKVCYFSRSQHPQPSLTLQRHTILYHMGRNIRTNFKRTL